MKFKKLFDRKNKDYVTIKVNTSNVPDGLLRKCKKCSSIVLAEDVKNNNYICPKCGGYMIEKGNKLVCADETCGYVEAKNDKEQ